MLLIASSATPPTSSEPRPSLSRQRFGWPVFLWAILSCAVAAAPVDAQTPADPPAGSNLFDAALTAPEALPPRPDGNDPVSNEELLARLRATEEQVRQLQAEHNRENPLVAMQDRWAQVRDPSITTVLQQTHKSPAAAAADSKKKWYDRMGIRGYAQVRYNTTLEEGAGSAPVQHVGDRSVGDGQELFIRRARLIFSGDISDHLYVYMQPEFAGAVPGVPDANLYVQLRDWYGDLNIDKEKVYRVRLGLSKVPYGWENLQSSSNRLPLDRSEAINSAARNERDVGAFFYWTPTEAQDLFKEVLDSGLKGSGNYGVFAIGVYNGQGGAFAEQNDNLHFVTRLALPYKFESGQIVEAGVQAYTGRFTVLSSPILPLGVGPAVRPTGTLETGNSPGIRDERVAGTLVVYPQPLGFQAEWSVGRGPGLNPEQTAVEERHLYGGYAMVMYRHQMERRGILFPFARFNLYRGGYKGERNSPFTAITEYEYGFEWQFNPQMELTLMHTITDRTNTTALTAGESYRQFQGQLLRSQFQINY